MHLSCEDLSVDIIQSDSENEDTFLGLPTDDARIDRFLKVASAPYARHELSILCRERSRLLEEVDYLISIGSLHRWIARRLEADKHDEMTANN